MHSPSLYVSINDLKVFSIINRSRDKRNKKALIYLFLRIRIKYFKEIVSLVNFNTLGLFPVINHITESEDVTHVARSTEEEGHRYL